MSIDGDDLSLWTTGLVAAVLAAAISVVLILLLRPLLRRYALARPNARSSHREPTPQGGGIAVIIATIIASYAAQYFLGLATTAPLAPIVTGAAAMAVVGVSDDIRPLEVAPRLILQTIIIGIVVYLLPAELRILPPLPFPAERVLLVLGGLWFVNLVNFMDGIDWMTVAEVVPVTAALGVLGGLRGLHVLPAYGFVVALALGGAMLGFAYFNRPVAKLFLGDVGSLPIGLLLAWLLFLVAAGGHLVAAILLPLYYLADSAVTLLWRLASGEPVWRAHRTHFYQVATDRGFSVTDVVARVFAVNVALAALAIVSIIIPTRIAQGATFLFGAALVSWLLATLARGKQRPG
jgi:UDP-N-acetylmuramyl pentapeptide phosphotransferase/UDP-N-acetylglucosamine-1-phosphate transferase